MIKNLVLICVFLSRSRFNSCPRNVSRRQGQRSLLCHFNIFKNSSISFRCFLPPFFGAKADAKITPFYTSLQIFFTIFSNFFFAPSLHPSSPGVNRHPLRESGCKDKATFIAFPNIQGTFFQEKINSRRISVRLNNLRGSGLVTR